MAVTAVLAAGGIGCRAQATPSSPHDLGLDSSAQVDLEGSQDLTVVSPPDLLPGADLACPPGPVEICGNGCDDDGNGYIDDDDPYCTAQLLATPFGGAPELDRLILGPTLTTRFVDGNPVNDGAHAMYRFGFTPGVAWLVYDAASDSLVEVALPPLGQRSMGAEMTLSPGYSTRDVCTFAGQLIVVDATGTLHQLDVTGTQTGSIKTAVNLILTSCASDGQRLYVAAHDSSVPTAPSVFWSTTSRSHWRLHPGRCRRRWRRAATIAVSTLPGPVAAFTGCSSPPTNSRTTASSTPSRSRRSPSTAESARRSTPAS